MNIGIIGKGRFGTYFTEQLRRVGYEVFIADDNVKDMSFVANRVGLLFFAVPISQFEECLTTIKPYMPEGLVFADVCSVKMHPISVVQKVMPDRVDRFVGTHPLFGPQSAPVSCFGQRVVLCTEESSGFASVLVRNVMQKLSLAIITTTAKARDEEMAYSQLINHFVGQSVNNSIIDRVQLSTATHDKFMDIVEIVTGNDYQLFLDMNKYNPYARAARQDLLISMTKMDNSLIKDELAR